MLVRRAAIAQDPGTALGQKRQRVEDGKDLGREHLDEGFALLLRDELGERAMLRHDEPPELSKESRSIRERGVAPARAEDFVGALHRARDGALVSDGDLAE